MLLSMPLLFAFEIENYYSDIGSILFSIVWTFTFIMNLECIVTVASLGLS